ncbi:MAG TPA: hypothetical protein VG077_19930 [Verrucomicrobiae bacterium]|nr:hypothetical protein [Verrucomicrobiae bacterium]
MKKCSYCGKEYAEGVTVCPMDGQPVIRSQAGPGKVATPPQGAQSAFEVRLVSPILSAGKYRVFVERSDLVFIQMEGGSKSILSAVAPLLGPVGNLIPLLLWLFAIRETKAKRRRLETKDPEQLLRESKANFKLNLAEIRDAAIEAPSRFLAIGKAGRLNLVVRHGERIRCEFENVAEMSRAICLLVPRLDSTLQVNVAWNAKMRRFEKKKNDLTR